MIFNISPNNNKQGKLSYSIYSQNEMWHENKNFLILLLDYFEWVINLSRSACIASSIAINFYDKDKCQYEACNVFFLFQCFNFF